MWKPRPSLQPMVEMNITNLIDVVFAILVVFMITAPLMTQGIKVDLPKAKAKSMDERKSISITITKEREIVIDDLPTDYRHFRMDFRKAWSGDPEQVVIVNSDEKVPYGYVMTVVGAVQDEGVTKLGFLTDPTQPARKLRSK